MWRAALGMCVMACAEPVVSLSGASASDAAVRDATTTRDATAPGVTTRDAGTRDAAPTDAGPDLRAEVRAHCEAYVERTVEWYARCVGLSLNWDGSECGETADDVAEGRLSFDRDKAARCIAASSSCSTPTLLEGCRDVFAGTALIGESCADRGCMPEAHCVLDALGCPTSCAPRARIGEPCQIDGCEADALCVGSPDNRCFAEPQLGESCVLGGWMVTPCAGGLGYCDGALCRPRLTDTSTCGAMGFGDPCGWIDSSCRESAGGELRCQPKLRLGEACARAQDCRNPLFCFEGRCRERPGLGERCMGSDGAESYCRGGLCRGGLCVPYLVEGEGCTEDFECGPSQRCLQRRCAPSPCD